MNNEPVRKLQHRLGLPMDGVFGPMTCRAAAAEFHLSDFRAAHFFGQVAHETGGFKVFQENLNYSGERLMVVFKRHFDSLDHAKRYHRQPEKIANRVYRLRMGNGDEGSGDGWRYRGRGAIQLTGKNNYREFAEHIGRPDLIENPNEVGFELAFDSALFFFEKNGLWEKCDLGIDENAIRLVTRAVNGGTNGLNDRIEWTKKVWGWLTQG